MTFTDLCKHFGSTIKAANALGVTKQCMYRWRDEGIPIGRQCQIQIQTGGVLQADKAKRKVISQVHAS